jgi:hypothetical protein
MKMTAKSAHTGARRASIFALPLLAAAAFTADASAVLLPPGGSVSLPGTATSGGVIIRDELIPFEILDGGGSILFGGVVQDRVVRRADGKLIFSKRIRDTYVDTPAAVVDAWVTDYNGLITDVDWDPTGPGQRRPLRAQRTGDGVLIRYDFTPDPIHETEESYFFYAETDAEAFAVTGDMTIIVDSGESTTITVASPAEDDTPPIGMIDVPTPLSCVCGTVDIEGVAYDPDGTYESDMLEYRPVFGNTWTLIGQSNTPTPPPGGVLYQWNTAGLPQGYYFLRLTVTNSAGLSTAAVTIVFVDAQFDTLDYVGPADGTVVGGFVCPHGTINDHCAEHFRIEYRPTGGGSFMPIDPGMPTYDGPRINQTFATWDTIGNNIPDGEYELRVTAFDDCDHVESDTRTIIVDNTPPTVEITSPEPCSNVEGIVQIIGTAFDENMAQWSVQYTGGGQPGWVTINTDTVNVVDGLLAEWDTTNLPPCPYTIRLIASDQAIINCNGAIHHISEYLVSVNVGGDTCPEDLNGDGVVNVFDLLDLLAAWGICP